MKTSTEINDMIQTCDLLPSEDVTRRLLEILDALNQRMDTIETDVKNAEKGAIGSIFAVEP